MLDEAACNLLTARARFSPARDDDGNAVSDMWSGNFVWRLPQDESTVLAMGTGVSLLVIDQTGSVLNCRIIMEIPVSARLENSCPEDEISFSPEVGLAMRGERPEPVVEVQLEMTHAFDAAAADKALLPKKGYDERALLVFQFEIDPSGKMVSCELNQQRGPAELIIDLCWQNGRKKFEPVAASNGHFISGPIWFIQRVLIKKPE